MSHLTPEQRVDKNGRVVTRHVRTDAAPTAGRNLPAPSMGSPITQHQTLNEQINEIKSTSRDKGIIVTPHALEGLDILGKNLPDAFSWVKDELSSASSYKTYLVLWHIGAATALNHSKLMRQTEAAQNLSDAARLGSLIAELNPDEDEGATTANVRTRKAKVLYANVSRAARSYQGESKENVSAGVALAIHLKGLDTAHTDLDMYGDHEDVEYIIDHYDDVLPLWKTIAERRSIKKDLVESVIQGSSAVSDGAL